MPSTSKKAAKTTAKKTTKTTARKAAKTTARVTMASSGKLLSDPASGRTVAASARDLDVSVAREVTRVMDEPRGSQAQSLQLGINRLVLDGYISQQDARQLKAIVDQMISATREPADLPRAVTRVGRLYQRMMMSGRSSPVALAIAGAFNASLAVSRVSGEPPRMSTMMMRFRASSVTAVVSGMIRGMIGGVVGGSLGAGIGAAVGLTAGAALGFRSDDSM